MGSSITIPSAGSYTYYYLAHEYSGSVSVADMQFNLIYFPTAYGTVDPVPPPVKSTDNNGLVWLDSSIRKKVYATQMESGVLDIAQLKHELEALKEKITDIQKQIDEVDSKHQ